MVRLGMRKERRGEERGEGGVEVEVEESRLAPIGKLLMKPEP